MESDIEYINNENNIVISKNLTNRDQWTLLFYLLYTAECFDYDISLEAITDNFYKGFNVFIEKDCNVFLSADGILKYYQQLDKDIQPLLANWRLERLGVATKIIIRIGSWYLKNSNLDKALVINESIELAKCFAEKDSYKFINGILDEFSKKIKR
jgi:N utilization substance protein B